MKRGSRFFDLMSRSPRRSRRHHGAVSPEVLEDRALLSASVDFNFQIVASDVHPDFRLFGSNDPEDAPFTIVRFGQITMTGLTDLPQLNGVVAQPEDLVLEFGSDDSNNPEEVARLGAFFGGVAPATPGVQNYRGGPGLDSDFVLMNDGVAAAGGVVQTIDADVLPPAGEGEEPRVTSDNVRLEFTHALGADTTIFDTIMDLTNGGGVLVFSLNTFSFTGPATGFGDSQVFEGTGFGDIGEGSVLGADDLPHEFIEGAGPQRLQPQTKTDPAGRTRLISFTQPGQGTVVDNGDGTVDFTPSQGASGTTSFTYQVGIQTLERTASDAETQDEFGHAVALDGDTAAVGVPLEDSAAPTAGAVYVFEMDADNEWREVQKITAGDAFDIDRFGYSVAVDNGVMVIGARADDDMGTNSGSAYVYHKVGDTWTEVAKLNDPTGKAKDQFGHSVAVDGDTIAVGARLDDGSGTNSGSAFIFERNLGGPDAWGFRTRIKAQDASGGDQFAFSLDLAGDTLIVGSRKDDSDLTAATDVGSAYFFGRNEGGADNWGQVKKLGGTGAANDWFGYSVSISGDTAIVGIPIRNNRLRQGSAIVYQEDIGGSQNWGEIKTLISPAPSDADQYGFSVGIAGDNVVVGARNDDNPGNNAGASYLYPRDFGGPGSFDLLATYNGEDNGDAYGTSVSINDTTVLSSAPRRDNDGPRSGSVFFEGLATETRTVTVDIIPSALRAEGTPPQTQTVAEISEDQLAGAISAAVGQWRQTNLSPSQIAAFKGIDFQVADLPGDRLGETRAGMVIIDSDAAGFGWYVDATPRNPYDDVIGGRMDLTTVVTHEIGHILGYKDVYGDTGDADVMSGYLSAGVRRFANSPASATPLDSVFRQVADDDLFSEMP